MKLKGKNVIVLVEDMYQEMELWYPVYRFREAGADVRIVGPAKKLYKSKLGYEAQADAAAGGIKAADIDVVIIPGGYAPDKMRLHKSMVKLVRDAMNKGKVVAAICHGGWMLCSAGGIAGKTVTGYIAIKDDLVNAGANYVDQEVAVDGKLITSRMPSDLPAFCREIRKALKGNDE